MDIGGYSITSEFTTAGGGRCQWAFARKGSTEYFLKCFLSPKQVIPGKTRGSPSTVAAQRARCTAFEIRHNKLLSALAGKSGAGGNLIAPIDFFSYDGKYYKVTEKVSTGVPPDRVSGLGHDSKLLVLRSAANSIRILHSAGIVHGDIKPDNIIVRDRGGGKTTSSIIDFDDSYFLGDPPMPPEELTFDPPYAAPEVFRFIVEPNLRTAGTLTDKADVFSLGVVFCEFITGRKATGNRHAYPGQSLLLGGSVVFPVFPAAWRSQAGLVSKMLDLSPHNRPTLAQVLEELPRPGGDERDAAPSAPDAPARRPSIVIGRGLGSSASAVPKAEPSSPSGTRPRIIIGRGLTSAKRDE